MYIGTAVLTVLCIWLTDSSCFGWTRPIANVGLLLGEVNLYITHAVGFMCPGSVSSSFHLRCAAHVHIFLPRGYQSKST